MIQIRKGAAGEGGRERQREREREEVLGVHEILVMISGVRRVNIIGRIEERERGEGGGMGW